MSIIEIIIVIIGLALFETVSSIDNAIINARVLGTVSARARRWFLSWGLVIAVLGVRGLLPLLIVYFANPSLGIGGAFSAAFSSDPQVSLAIEATKPILLAGGGLYLLLLFLHWLLTETKAYAFRYEQIMHEHYAAWFNALASVVLVVIVWLMIDHNPTAALGAVIGSAAFFITTGFKQNAEDKEQELEHGRGASDLSKLIYLELIDATFSVDGVLGAFAFTTAVPLILLGNGLGAVIVRQITIRGSSAVERYQYLGNGAMYSIAVLGLVMIIEALGHDIAFWISPLITVVVVGYFFWRSRQEAA